ncbi:glycosyltransferase [Roseococcus sp.]|uniref:glycosyltransferase n=1 Tax=Roseococcus sp. TaxID=2109646 RepID=UPI003BAC2C67
MPVDLPAHPGKHFLSRQFRRLRKLAYWTVSGQLPAQLRARQDMIRARWAFLVDTVMLRAGTRSPLRSRLGLPAALPTPAAASLVLPTSDAPVLSILIPTYGQVDYTLRCLATLAAHPPRVPFEVLVADDASADPQLPQLRQVRGIRLTERTANLGFLRSCNAAALDARGQFLFLLNNDTEVMPGALDALLDTLRDHPRAGLAGARLLYPDGWQQEAGGILWDDASAWNYGNRDDPRKPQYCYLREADYISGAAIMIPTDLWRALGGFDEHYLPAYCEDSDLALRIRQAGRSVLYQPRAIVIHHEGVSHGTDTNQGLKAYQVTNRDKLLQRWAGLLAEDQLPNGQRVLRARDRARHRKVTLVLDNNVPEPDRDAGSRTMVAFMEALIAAGRVVKFWPLNGLALPGYTEALQQRGVEVLYGPWSGSFARWITENGAEIDEVLLSRPHVAAETLALLRRHTAAPIVFYGHDLHHARVRREAEATGQTSALAEAERLLAEERLAWRGADLSLYPSEEEAQAVRALEPGAAVRAITPYALAEREGPAPVPEGRDGLLFVAGFGHSPNEDAAVWFVRDILPRVRAARPGTRLTLAGSNPTPAVQALAGEEIEVTGFVTEAELARRYDAARVVVCPLRFGAGVKMKVVEALHQGVPLVTTQVGAQGLEGLGEAIDVTDRPEDFAAAILRLLTDDRYWIQRSEAAARFTSGRFSQEALRLDLASAFEAAEQTAAPRAGGISAAG